MNTSNSTPTKGASKTLYTNLILILVIFTSFFLLSFCYINFFKKVTFESYGVIYTKYTSDENSLKSIDQINSEQLYLSDFNNMFNSDEMIESIAKDTGYSEDTIRESIAINRNGNSNYIRITAKSESSDQAYKIAESAVSNSVNNLSNESISFQISQKVTKDKKKGVTSKQKYYKFSFVLSLFVACLALVIKVNFYDKDVKMQ